MNEKLSIQNLIELLAEKHGMNKLDAENFVKEFFQLIEESLENDKYVKIKGLGTFKLINVESRESVNISTGERFQIQGHTKVSFTPEPSLKDIINKPFSHFETVVLNDGTVLEDTPTDANAEDEEETKEEEESTGGTSEKPQTTPVSEPAEATEENVQVAELPAETSEDIAEVLEEKTETVEVAAEQPEMTVDEVEESSPEVEPADEVAEPAEDIAEQQVVAEQVPADEDAEAPVSSEDKPEKSSVKFFIGIVVLVVLLCVGAVLFMYYPDLQDRLQPMPTDKEAVGAADARPGIAIPLTDSVIRTDSTHVAEIDTVAEALAATPSVASRPVATVKPAEKEKAPGTAAKSEKKKPTAAPVEPDSVNYKIVGTKTTYTIKEGETLTRVALRFYGAKALWPYIVKHNPGVIKNPDNVPYGTVIKIPELVKK